MTLLRKKLVPKHVLQLNTVRISTIRIEGKESPRGNNVYVIAIKLSEIIKQLSDRVIYILKNYGER